MSEGHDQARFAPRPRRQATNSHDRANLDAELELIRARIDTVTARGRDDFHDGQETYDVARMVTIRLAALLERAKFEPHMEAVTQQERLAIRTTRNIAAHTGYRSMNDNLFWLAVTQRDHWCGRSRPTLPNRDPDAVGQRDGVPTNAW